MALERNTCIHYLLRRARWYRLALEKKYLMVDEDSHAKGGEDRVSGGAADLATLEAQNSQLKEAVRQLAEQFPDLRGPLKRLSNVVL